ncbi:MAG: peptidylprolyl isomerase [Bdellovibrionota bacterium]|nr:peptidylprolyl isomerase [Bdellovibrionota bacterium]
MKKVLFIALMVTSLFVKAEDYDRILAVVNGEILTLSDMNQYKARLKSQKLADDLFKVNPETLLKNKKLLIDHLIDQKIVDSEVSRLGLEIGPERVEHEINKIAEGLGITRDDLMKRLKTDGIDFSEYRNFIKSRVERQSLIQREITSKIRISDDELKSFYAKKASGSNVDAFEYNLSHILLQVKDSEDKAKERAENVYSKIQKGLNFSEAASQYSEDPNFSSGGFLGVFKSGEFLPAFENAVKNLDEGGTAKPIKVGSNFIILKVNKKQIVESPQFLAQKERIRSYLTQEAFKKQFQFWLVQKRSDSDIRIN